MPFAPSECAPRAAIGSLSAYAWPSSAAHVQRALACLVLLSLALPLLLLQDGPLAPLLPGLSPVSGQVYYPDNPLFWSWSGNLSVTTAGGGILTIVGDYFLAPGQCSIQPSILFNFDNGQQSLCQLTYQANSGQLLECLIPPGTGTPHVTINICGQLNRDLPRMPQDMVYYVGTTPPMSLAWCHVWNNTQAPGFNGATSNETNWMCSSDQRQKLSSTGHNTNDRSLFTFCAPTSAPGANPTSYANCLAMQTAKRCISIYDPIYPRAWQYYTGGVSYNFSFCTELASPYTFTWNPNCTSSYCQNNCMRVQNPWSNSSTFTSGRAYLCTSTFPSPFPTPDTELEYHYAPPLIASASFPLGNPTAGGVQVTLQGSSFGYQNVSSVLVLPSNQPCNVTALNHTYATCTMPPGQGTAYFQMTVDGTVSAGLFQFQYDPPYVLSLGPQLPDAAGGANLTITGLNFGSVGTVTVQVAIGTSLTNKLCTPVWQYNNTQIVCAVPPGQGANQSVVIASGTSVNPAGSAVLSYMQPNLAVVSSTAYDTGGGAVLSLNGTSFGSAGAVTVGGLACALTGIGYSNTAIQCILPAGQGVQQPVVITASAQVNTPARYLSYNPPVLNPIAQQGGTGSTLQLTVGGASLGNGSASAVYVNGQPCAVAVGQWHQSGVTCTAPASAGLYLPVYVNVSGQVSNTQPFSYSPTITNVSAPGGTAPTAGGVAILVTGTGFASRSVANFTVYFGSSLCNVTAQTNTTMTCTLPPGGGTVSVIASVNVTVVVLYSTAFAFSYDPPTLLSIWPLTGPTAGNTTLQVSGNNFGLSPSVTVNNANCPLVGAHNNTFLTCSTPAGAGSGNAVIVSSGGGLYTTALSFGYYGPSIASLSPSGGKSAGGYNVTVAGGNFSVFPAQTIVLVSGVKATVLSQNDTALVIVMPPFTNSLVVYITVQVSGQTSPSSPEFTYQGASVSLVQPASATTAGAVLMRISGSNFGSSGYVLFGSTQAALTGAGYSDTYIECLLPAGMGAAPVTVTVGGVPSLPWAWSYIAPNLTQPVSPVTSPTSGLVLLTLTGTNFGTAGAVTIGPYTCSTSVPGSSYTQTQIVCQIPPGQGANLTLNVNVAGQTLLAPPQYSYLPPSVVSNINPQAGPTLGGGVLTLYGSNFGLSASVTFVNPASPSAQYLTCAPYGLGQSHTQIQCTVPAFQGLSIPLFVNVSGQLSSGFPDVRVQTRPSSTASASCRARPRAECW